MAKAFLTLWLIWIMLNRCGQVLLVSSTTLPRSYNSVPAGLFIWIELLSCWPSLVSRPTDCRQCRSLLFAKAYLSNECMRLFPGLVSNLIHLREALKMCPLPSVTASPSKEITVTCYAKQKSYRLVEALQNCLHLRTTGSTKNKPRCIFKFPDELDQCTEPPLILGPQHSAWSILEDICNEHRNDYQESEEYYKDAVMLCIERLQFSISSQKLSAPAFCQIPEADKALQSPVMFVICWQIFSPCLLFTPLVVLVLSLASVPVSFKTPRELNICTWFELK